MNDVLYKLYAVTGDWRHLLLAHLFDKPCFLGLLAVKADDISGFHANTHIPVVIGSQMRYEVTGDSLYKEIGTFFMDIVNSSHSYATGGTSVNKKSKRVSYSSYCCGFRCLNTYIGHPRPCDRSKWICYSYSYSCNCYRNCCR